MAEDQLLDDQPGLDRLAEADVVRDQEVDAGLCIARTTGSS